MVFCVSCGHKLAGRYCGQCGGDSQSTADAQSELEVPVLTKRKGSAAASKRKGSAAGGIGPGVAQASGHWQVLENLPAAVVPDPSDPSSDEGGDSREGEGGGEMQGTAPVLIIPSPVISSSRSEEEEDLEHDMEEEQEEKKEAPPASRKRKKT